MNTYIFPILEPRPKVLISSAYYEYEYDVLFFAYVETHFTVGIR